MASIGLSASWLAQVGDEFKRDYMVNLKQFLLAERSAGKEIFPKGSEYFAALNAVAYEDVRVVILGQDPYHGPGQAHGLSFSVPKGIRIPPSLKNIYQELAQDLGLQASDFSHGYLERWASQGVLLLNSVLTVSAGAAASHRGKGWEQFTDQVIRSLGKRQAPLVFMLWGSFAAAKASMIKGDQHLILKAPHPSPLSAYRGFFGCQHFSKCNEFLAERGEPIDWRVSPEDH